MVRLGSVCAALVLVASGCTRPPDGAEASVPGHARAQPSVVAEARTAPKSAADPATSTSAGAPSPAATADPSAAPASVDAVQETVDDAADGPSVVELMRLDGSHSTSIGSPLDGRLEGAAALPTDAVGLRSNPRRPNIGAHFGTVEMVQSLVRAAAVVERELPGSRVTVNDLGFEDGGRIPHHGSHRSGRDADVLFYLLDADGAPREGKGVPIDPRGRGWDFGDLVDPADDVEVKLDVPRTWRFLQALVEDPDAHVQRVFVVEHVREMLLAHARRVRAPSRAIALVGLMTCQPGSPHDDHLHIRYFCTAEDVRAGCEDTFPIYGWHRRSMRRLGAEPVLARGRRRTTPPPAVVSREEARAAAGPMHERVRAFLDQREAWADKPSPGRPFCP